jgi:hypothetical protein
MKEIKNFLPKEQFKQLQSLIFDINFPWRIRSEMVLGDKNMFFGHTFFNYLQPRSEYYYSLIVPILEKLNCKAVIEVRSNMYFNKLFNKSGWHIDHDVMKEEMNEHTTAILYLNTCNGGTELKIKEKIKFIKAEENKIVIFSSKTLHRAVTSTDADKRYIINFNYVQI